MATTVSKSPLRSQVVAKEVGSIHSNSLTEGDWVLKGHCPLVDRDPVSVQGLAFQSRVPGSWVQVCFP